MFVRHKNWLRVALVMFAMGFALIVIPPYKAYCENNYANQYNCSGYEIVASFIAFTETYNGAIAAVAAVVIAIFTAIIKGINREQLKHAREIERAYIFARVVRREEIYKGAKDIPPI